ncbi:MAG TPA: choice-of-anchor tandem repeat GloVer-containing protein [Verrucomicrobiae bacterium]|jgi:uncharacterized repeat protein (TIGR03803 family)|nr:choice-of-anchor tandem repeat GloVer-containing protein [Verrucomicrobiae bacterium]
MKTAILAVILCLAGRALIAQPQILVPPQSQTVPTTFTASFGVDVSSSLGYQWFFNNQPITNATNHVLNVINAQQTNAGSYYVLVTNASGSATSSNVTLTVTNVPVMVSNLQFTTIASLGNSSTGSLPQAGVIQASDGFLYGTTVEGGVNGDGAVFKLSTNGTFAWIYSFTGSSDGASPVDSLIQTPDGNLYGTAESGGLHGFGDVFRITTNGALISLYSFQPGNGDGGYPESPLCLGGDGFLYGTTITNDAGGEGGTIFKMDTNGNLQWSYGLTAANGLRPLGGLTEGTNGYFYGATSVSGANGLGTVYVISASGSFTNLYSFTGGADGGYPRAGLVQGTNGQFYGTTTQGGNLSLNGGAGYGTIFEITTNGVLKALYAFDITNGSWPEIGVLGGLVVQPEGGLMLARDGNFYGMAASGGIGDAYDNGNELPAIFGTVFQMTPSGSLTTLLSFNGNYDGAVPLATLWQGQDDALYGTTSNGGDNDLASGGDGTVFRIGVARPSIQSARKTGTTFSFTWNAFVNEPYQTQYKDNLSQTNWVNLGSPMIGTNGLDGESDTITATNAHRFYRVLFDF